MSEIPDDEQPRRGEDAPSTRRRSVLKALSAPPLAMALAGCPGGSDGGVKSDETDGAGPPGDLSPGATLAFEDAISGAGSYEFSVTTGDGETTVTGRVTDGDQYVRTVRAGQTEQGGPATETYLVDGRGYLVTATQCLKYDAGSGSREPGGDSDSGAGSTELRLVDRTTAEGRELYRFEPVEQQTTAPTVSESSGTATPTDESDAGKLLYYVDVETGYLRRIERGATAVEYGSWGSVAPVTPPERECEPYEMPTAGETPTPTPTDPERDTPTQTQTPVPTGPTTPTESVTIPDEWETDRTQEYTLDDRVSAQVAVSGEQITLVQFVAEFPVDVYTVPIEVAADFPSEAALSRTVDSLTSTGRPAGLLVGVLSGNDHVVFVDNTAEIGVEPPSSDAVTELSLRLAFE